MDCLSHAACAGSRRSRQPGGACRKRPLATVSRKVSELEAHLIRSSRALVPTDAAAPIAASKRILADVTEAAQPFEAKRERRCDSGLKIRSRGHYHEVAVA